jgi:hypothetical protein
MHTLRYNDNNVLIYIQSYMFRISLSLRQGMHGFVKGPIVISGIWNCRNFVNV